MNQARSEEEEKERKRDRKDRGQEADGKKGSPTKPTKQKPIGLTKTRHTYISTARVKTMFEEERLTSLATECNPLAPAFLGYFIHIFTPLVEFKKME